MLIVQTPFRMSFFGGGTDIKEFYEVYGGSVLSATFDKYCYHIIRKFPPFFEHKNLLTYSKIERFNDADEVQHPVVRETLKYMNMNNISIMYDADLPARSGLGTSSSFSVGLLNGLHSLRAEFVDKKKLAEEAIYVERELCKEKGGLQDQIAVSYGGFNRIDFTADGFEVKPVIIKKEKKRLLNDSLMLFFTGFVRFSSDIISEQIQTMNERINQLKEMKGLVDEGERILTGSSDINEFGKLLHHTWELKRSLSSKISNSYIDDVYLKAINAGALGGKILGAGGGGFILFYVEPDKQESVRKALADFTYIPFEFENSGTKVIFYKEEN